MIIKKWVKLPFVKYNFQPLILSNWKILYQFINMIVSLTN